jgi:cytochrome b
MNKKILIWDPLVRIFHWSLVLAFCISYLTGEEESDLHIYAGYAVLGLIIFRVLWGLIGGKYARFSNFMSSPVEAIKYIKELTTKTPKHYLGHNPAGGWMIVALLVSLFVVSISGLKVYAIEEGRGPLAGATTDFSLIGIAFADRDEEDDDEKEENENEEFELYRDKEEGEQDEEFWEEIHEVSANFTLLLIFLHIAGVIVASRVHNENLVKAMITGKKRVK